MHNLMRREMKQFRKVPHYEVLEKYREYNHSETLTLEPNIPLLRKEVEWVENQEELRKRDFEEFHSQDHRWSQETWMEVTMCGTACCVAGNVAMHEGEIIQSIDNYGNIVGTYAYDEVADEYSEISNFAQLKLGINHKERAMFTGDNKAADIRRYAEQAAERVGETL